MNKICTSIEQSKKLIELGIDVNTADMYYFTIIRNYPYSQGKIKTIAKIMDGSFSSNYDIPAWSLTALLDILPILERKGYQKAKPQLLYNVDINKWIVDSHVYTTNAYDNPVDACYEMVCWLKENGKI